MFLSNKDEEYDRSLITKLYPIAKDADGKLYWVRPWHVLPSGILPSGNTLDQFTRKVIRDYLERREYERREKEDLRKLSKEIKEIFVEEEKEHLLDNIFVGRLWHNI